MKRLMYFAISVLLASTCEAQAIRGLADVSIIDRDSGVVLDTHYYHGDYWVAGRPGSVVLHSVDKGQTWKLLGTGQPLPLHGVCFLNEQKGWAVGELGTVETHLVISRSAALSFRRDSTG